MVPNDDTFIDVWMKLNRIEDRYKNKLSEKDGNSILGYCKLKTHFDYPWEKKILKKVSW